MILTLEKEKEELEKNLKIAKSKQNEGKDSKLKANIKRLIEIGDKYESEIKTEKEQVSNCYAKYKQSSKIILSI